jgi:hypothetical protein
MEVGISDKWFLSRKQAFAMTVILGYPFPKQAMEMASTSGVFRSATAKRDRNPRPLGIKGSREL